ncbi:hypothetical protein PFICI_12765 [Pestalotiopsis fici W106-1]|uniref:Thioredoxin domain-containing protein n=1 Tax=Pestalotiopsis fici (strain W106-1 / CGMCC3.15140) TaxID=1229662 RepID=W3WSM0_PESFW|nr:uncharacterized protein PFICI_12765 [Pestalotiopsis fici W106-1]ETS75821.1 hypothetical protein PFICI_12765 [Pestalotiopsis fici W106-1]
MTSQDPTAPTHPVHVVQTLESYNELLSSHQYVVVDFHATWCGPCKAMNPLFTQHATKHASPGQIAFAKIDIDEVPDVAARYRVTHIPTFLFVRNGEAYEEVRSANPPKLQAAIEEMAAEQIAKGNVTAAGKGGAKDDGNEVAKAIEDSDW